MNTLSWMIYLAGVAGGISFLLGAAGLVSLALWLGWPVRNAWLVDFRDGEGVGPPSYRLLGLTAIAWLLVAVVPSKETVYAIAASEMGETALKSETGGKAVQALNAWLDRQIEGEPGE